MSNLYTDAANTIRSAVSMKECCRFYGLEIERGEFAKCCFHGGDNTPSMKIYDNSFYCFACHEHGSVIDFVMKYFALDFKAAVERIDSDFNLRLVLKSPNVMKNRIAAGRVNRIRLEAERKKKAEEESEAAYWAKVDRYIKYDRAKREKAPSSPDDISDEYSEACKYLEYSAEGW